MRREDQPKQHKTGDEVEENKVHYQAEDFLKKYDKLNEKTVSLVKELCDASIQ